MNTFHIYIQEVCLYLDRAQIRDELILVCKDWETLLNTENYINYWIRSFLNLDMPIPFPNLKSIIKNTNSNKLLNFSAWKTNGGMSNIEVNSSYKNMWVYDCSTFSTYYSTTEPLPLMKNVDCLAIYQGGYMRKDKYFDNYCIDLYSVLYTNVIDKYKIEHYDMQKCLTLDPLNNVIIEDLWSINIRDFNQDQELDAEKCRLPIVYDINPVKSSALVTKVAISRPFLFTGSVKTLLLIVNKNFNECSFSDFCGFNDITNIDSALLLGAVKKVTKNDEFEIVEYKRTSGFYPLIWLNFKHCGVNHIEYNLAEGHIVSVINCKLIEIDDRRNDWGLENFQPNFDIRYVALIGKEIRY